MVRPSATTTLPVAAGLRLDLVGRRLSRNGSSVHLRPREYQLLAALAANPGQAMTRRQLVDMAWRPARDLDLRSIDVHVHWLRSKIEPVPHHPAHLVTVRGYGYRLDPGPR